MTRKASTGWPVWGRRTSRCSTPPGLATVRYWMSWSVPLFGPRRPPREVAASLGDLVSDADRSAISGELADVFRDSVRNGIWGWYDDEVALSNGRA